MSALHGSCLLPSPVCICKGVEDGLCSAQQAGTLNVSKNRYGAEKTKSYWTINTQHSPFRYPGGKTWLVPHIRQWLASLPKRPSEFIEPFAGGGIVSLTVAIERLADTVIMVELDDQVAAVWQT